MPSACIDHVRGPAKQSLIDMHVENNAAGAESFAAFWLYEAAPYDGLRQWWTDT